MRTLLVLFVLYLPLLYEQTPRTSAIGCGWGPWPPCEVRR